MVKKCAERKWLRTGIINAHGNEKQLVVLGQFMETASG